MYEIFVPVPENMKVILLIVTFCVWVTVASALECCIKNEDVMFGVPGQTTLLLHWTPLLLLEQVIPRMPSSWVQFVPEQVRLSVKLVPPQ
jgi:hypothetical protein